jgi:hypothetical protein
MWEPQTLATLRACTGIPLPLLLHFYVIMSVITAHVRTFILHRKYWKRFNCLK